MSDDPTTSTSVNKTPSGRRRNAKNKKSDQVAVSDRQLYGFHPLRSLRNIFFGYRNKKSRRASDGFVLSRARSIENVNSPPTDTPPAQPIAVTTTARPTAQPQRSGRSKAPYNKLLSISADDLLETSEWKANRDIDHSASSHSTSSVKQASEMSTGSVDSRDSSSREPSMASSEDLLQVEEFYKNWTDSNKKPVTRQAMSEGDIVLDDNVDDFDLVASKVHSLDFSSAKDKLAVRPQGKRLSAAYQQKVQLARQQQQQVAARSRSMELDVVAEDEMEVEDPFVAGQSFLPYSETYYTINGSTSQTPQDRQMNTTVITPSSGQNVQRQSLEKAEADQSPTDTSSSRPRLAINDNILAEALRKAATKSKSPARPQPSPRPARNNNTAAPEADDRPSALRADSDNASRSTPVLLKPVRTKESNQGEDLDDTVTGYRKQSDEPITDDNKGLPLAEEIRRLRPRPQTMAPSDGGRSNEPEWLALAQRKTRDWSDTK